MFFSLVYGGRRQAPGAPFFYINITQAFELDRQGFCRIYTKHGLIISEVDKFFKIATNVTVGVGSWRLVGYFTVAPSNLLSNPQSAFSTYVISVTFSFIKHARQGKQLSEFFSLTLQKSAFDRIVNFVHSQRWSVLGSKHAHGLKLEMANLLSI